MSDMDVIVGCIGCSIVGFVGGYAIAYIQWMLK